MRTLAIVGLALGLLWSAATAGARAEAVGGLGQDERAEITRLISEEGEELLLTGLPLRAGDRFVAPDDRLFEVTVVRDGVARARQVGRVGPQSRWPTPLLALPGGPAPARGLSVGAVSPREVAAPRPRDVRVGLYHTHTDESYLPDAGQTNEPWDGDILRVGARLAQVLRGYGLDVLHSTRRHDPHDGMAYARSRRTALELLRQRPAALFDVHRDTPPAEVYLREIAGQMATSVLLVVGRQNPNLSANEAFAFTIKGYADRAYPGLIRGILYAAGDYNQDLFPRALLAEVGSTHNRLAHAEAGARFFGDVVAATLADVVPGPGLPRPDLGAEQARASRRGWQAAAFLVTLVGAGVALYLLVNERSYQQLSRLLARLRAWREQGRLAWAALAERVAEVWRRLRRRGGLPGGP